LVPLLPQDDPKPDKRQKALAKAQKDYQYDLKSFAPCARAAKVPLKDGFALKWLFEAGERALEVVDNHVEVETAEGRAAKKSSRTLLLASLVSKAATEIDGLITVVEEALGAAEDTGSFTSLDAYSTMFQSIKAPAIAADWKSDLTYALMRVAGPNPLVIQAVTAPDARFPVTEAIFQQVLPGDSMAAAGAEGRLFLADYSALEGVVNGDFPGGLQKYLTAPLALFAVEKGTRQLVPVAIQCRQQPGPDNPIFTPDGSINWMMARTVVEVADGNYHQAISHLGRTHMFVEPFVVATQRQLAANHPLGILLRPHFQGTLAINKAAVEQLAAPGGSVDELLAGTIQSTVQLTTTGVQSNRVEDAFLPNALKKRGCDDSARLPNYPYRDDALLYWHAIHDWVDAYLKIYYHSDTDVVNDTELQAWYRDVSSPDGGRIASIDTGAPAATLAYLTDVTTLLIFTASVQHAAVNFPQFDLMAFVPNMPLAAYKPAPKERTGATEADWLAMLSPKKPALRQLSLGYILGTLHYGQLGQYDDDAFDDERVDEPLKAFQDRLAQIGATIDDRNHTRRPYSFLVASGVPQSINV
jgi:arachidonate 15-lipoxygenase